jgi:uncharacterized radical SAM protein YgiQ
MALQQPRYLPMTREEMRSLGWSELDVLLVTGDGYFDHPSHGAAAVGRALVAAGFRTGIIARPDWRSAEPFCALGRPLLFAGITAGAVDSALNNRTAEGKPRRADAYAPGGIGGGRPDFATLVYANRVREAFPDLPIVLGGVEASTRRFAYFDPTSRKLRRSILVDSRSDVLVFGPGELQAIEIAERLGSGRGIEGIAGTARLVRGAAPGSSASDVALPDFAALEADSAQLLRQSVLLERCGNPAFSGRALQRYAEGLVTCEPPRRYATEDLDALAALPFARMEHPSYAARIPALETVRWSIASHRGCPGGCSFCALSFHQGRGVVPRSAASVLDELRELSRRPGFRGTITDVGGPTANAYGASPRDTRRCERCERPSCFHPEICRNLSRDHGALLDLLDACRAVAGVAHVFLASGVRHDLALADPRFIDVVARAHTGGHLKVAPEHVAPGVLARMRKPGIGAFEEFERRFLEASRSAGKEQYLVPYFISGFPGCTPREADAVGAWLARRGQRLEQVQGYIPLPGTHAAALFACGVDEDGRGLFLPDAAERARQKSILTGGGALRVEEKRPAPRRPATPRPPRKKRSVR